MSAYSLSTAIALAFLVASAHTASMPCGNGFYDPSKGDNCFGGKYACGAGTGSCACPHPSDPGYDCFYPYPQGNYGCPTTPPNSFSGLAFQSSDDGRAVCTSSSRGDPLMTGFEGCNWYLTGKPGTVLNLITERNHVVNTQLVAANLTDEHHSGEGTFHGAISVRFGDVLVVSSVTTEGNLTVHFDNKPVRFEATREQHGCTVKVSQNYPYFGQVAEIVTPAFRFFLHAVQPYDSPAGWSRGHLDFSATAVSAQLSMHGLLGQGSAKAGHLCSDDLKFHGEGKEEDYEVASLDSTDYEHSLFAKSKATRKLQTLGTDHEHQYTPTAVALRAGSSSLV